MLPCPRCRPETIGSSILCELHMLTALQHVQTLLADTAVSLDQVARRAARLAEESSARFVDTVAAVRDTGLRPGG